MSTSTMTSKGQITIPKRVRERLGLQRGDRLVFRFQENGTLTMARETSEAPGAQLVGLLRHLAPERPVSVEEMNESVRVRAAQKHRAARGG